MDKKFEIMVKNDELGEKIVGIVGFEFDYQEACEKRMIGNENICKCMKSFIGRRICRILVNDEICGRK